MSADLVKSRDALGAAHEARYERLTLVARLLASIRDFLTDDRERDARDGALDDHWRGRCPRSHFRRHHARQHVGLRRNRQQEGRSMRIRVIAMCWSLVPGPGGV